MSAQSSCRDLKPLEVTLVNSSINSIIAADSFNSSGKAIFLCLNNGSATLNLVNLLVLGRKPSSPLDLSLAIMK